LKSSLFQSADIFIINTAVKKGKKKWGYNVTIPAPIIQVE